MFSKFFINRPIFATVLALLIVVAGLVTLNILPVAQFPEITPPTVQVSAVYPGANAETVAQTVGIPIEQKSTFLNKENSVFEWAVQFFIFGHLVFQDLLHFYVVIKISVISQIHCTMKLRINSQFI